MVLIVKETVDMAGDKPSIVEQIIEMAEKSAEKIEQVNNGQIVFVVNHGKVTRIKREDGWTKDDLNS